MTLPKPSEGERHDAFVARFETDGAVRAEFTAPRVRSAAAEAVWAQHAGARPSPNGAVRANGELVMYGIIGDDVDGLDARTLMGELDGLGLGANDSLTARLNSPGGFVAEGLAIYNLLRATPANVRMEIDGVAASMASVVAMAGDTIVMPANAVMMIHNPWNMAIGDAEEMRRAAEQLDLLRDAIAGIYAGRSGNSVDAVIEMMAEETWLSADDAVTLGFADEVGAEVRAAALTQFDLSQHFNKVPPALAGGHAGGAAAAVEPGRQAGSYTKGPEMADNSKTAPAAATTAEPTPTQTSTPAQASVTPEPGTAATSAQASADADEIRRQATEAERARVAGINRAVRAAKLPPEQADEMIRDGLSVEQAQARVIDSWAASDGPDTSSHLRVSSVEDAQDKWMQGAQNAIIARAGKAKMVGEATGEKVQPGEFRGMTMLDLARDCLDRAGVKSRGMSKMEIMGKALTLQPMNATPYQTTGDFATLLENTMHKVLQAAYGNTPDTWSRFCATGSVSDFRPHNRYRMGAFSRLDTLTESGEFKSKPISDAEKEVMQASTYGNMISLSRQALISDDLSAFDRLATMLGRAARLSIEMDVYNLFAENGGNGPTMNDGKAFFHADHNNLASTSGAPSVATFDDARVTMSRQRDPWGNDYLDIRPSIWVGPMGLGGDARVVNEAQFDPSKTQRTPNKGRGVFNDIVDTPRLTGTPWYAFADPAQIPAFEVAFLEGETQPFLESDEGWRVDGVEWKVRHDYGVAAIDYRGAVKNAGA